MPSVDIAMARSLQDGRWSKLSDSLARSITSHLVKKNIVAETVGKVTDIRTALSSWDNCMAASFCKWPAIAIMAVGGLIILSILLCIVRCCCLGKSCCCACFSCLKCCGNCCGCCDPPGGPKHKYLDEPYIPPHQGYRTEAPMQPFAPVVGPSAGVTAPPQYAEFDMKKGDQDSLPQMPSWDGAGSSSKKVALEEEAHEMNNLKQSHNGSNDASASYTTNGVIPGPNAGPIPMENLQSSYGSPAGNPTLPMISGMGHPSDPYAPRDPYETNKELGYNHHESQADGYGLDQPYDLPPAGMAAVPAGRNSPAPTYQTYPQNRMNHGPADMPNPDEYGAPVAPRDPYRSNPASPAPGYGGMQRRPTGDSAYSQRMASPGPGPGGYANRTGNNSPAPGVPGGYGNRTGNNSPAPYGMDPRMRNSPGPRNSPVPIRPRVDTYNRRSPGHSPTSPSGHGGYGQTYSPTRENFARTQSPAPVFDRQYAQSPRPLQRPVPESPLAQQEVAPPASPIVNNSGFDFTSGFSRPQTRDNSYDRRPSESQEAPAQEGYPGYKPYRPAQEGWSGV